ncbi:accessory Sec system glycosyltransferase GtfA [Streptococcus sp. NLN64]|uniref:accessory Sec system glycosyltransferase GtfA n=1 Tax=Streptococcus sp. NLN64 TaxID=2822799 RepID=UPI0018CA2F3F|nr:accessory Sec system glycosyltransferase GtfA [Streptococcus sp. NLN64]MBG9366821.1 accessory Sec system glycosyltransferase GtfA [Streptococcus sp. NLN64]
MTVYSINLGIGWASSGVEYAQSYRAEIFRELQLPAKFIFTDLFQTENLQHFTSNIGFKDEEIIWLYSFFTDLKIAPTSYSRRQLEASFAAPVQRTEVGVKLVRYHFSEDFYINASLCGPEEAYVQRVEYVVKGKLIRKDYYSYTKVFTEFYAPVNDKPQLYQRHFFNEDGSLAYEEVLYNQKSTFRFPDRILNGKEALVAYMLEKLNLTSQDILLLDRATGIGQAVFAHKGSAKLAVVIHAEHYNAKGTDDYNVLWNNYYEYQFTNAHLVDAFITSTEKQKEVLDQQFKTYTKHQPRIYAIPVGSLDQLRRPDQARKPYSLMTSSRLASEKHIDWLVNAVIEARKTLPELTFDIYGEGGERRKLTEMIEAEDAEAYIQLKGHQQLAEIYKNYQVYLTASTSEGFGLTLMEAVGSGLPLIGLDVPYGNQTFVDDGKNGYLIPRPEADDPAYMTQAFSDKIRTYYQANRTEEAQEASYQKAEPFLHEHLAQLWAAFVEEVGHA